MAFELGLYEQLITKLIANKLNSIDSDAFFIKSAKLDKVEASRYLSQYLAETIQFALSSFTDDNDCSIKQINLSNKIIQSLIEELPSLNFSENLIDNEGKLLQAIFSKFDSPFSDLNERVKQITPYTRLSQSELFTGSNVGISLESELKKEILSSDEICWLVSFIKYSGIRIFKEELEEFTNSGKKLRIITTSYMGATDVKAVEFLASLKNQKKKAQYNTTH